MTTKTKIFIDFDGTIFDSQRFKHDLHQAIAKAVGADIVAIENIYKEWKINHHPNPLAMVREAVAPRYPSVNLTTILQAVRTIINNAKDYLFPDVINFLERMDRGRFSPKLFTLGDKTFQSRKIEACGIASLFDEVIFTDQEKSEAIKDLVESSERFFVIDDTAVFMSKVREDFGNSAEIIGVDRYGKYQDDDNGIEFSTDLKRIGTFREPAEELKVS